VSALMFGSLGVGEVVPALLILLRLRLHVVTEGGGAWFCRCTQL
jgi:hypothetical protein